MKIQLTYFIFLITFPLASFAAEICPVGTKAFTCATSKGEILLNRCSTASACYDKEYEKQTLRCCPIKETTTDSKKSFLELIKNSTDENLNKFKQTCNYSSIIDFSEDNEVIDATKTSLSTASLPFIRGLIFAEVSCSNELGSEQIFRWLGNEILLQQTGNLIQALSDEKSDSKKFSLAGTIKDEWANTECVEKKCFDERNTFLEQKKAALKNVKIPPSQKNIRDGLLKSLQ